MINSSFQSGINQYQTIDLETRIASASPHEVINLLLQGLKTTISAAEAYISRMQIAEKGHAINKALNILDALRTSLDQENGGEIALNLDKLYDYIQRLIVNANVKNDVVLLTQANQLIDQVHQAWGEMPQS